MQKKILGKLILFLKNFYDEQIVKNSFSEKNLWKVLYYNGKQSLRDLLYFEIFRSKNINKKLVNLVNFFEDKEVPIFPIKAKNIMEKYNISEISISGGVAANSLLRKTIKNYSKELKWNCYFPKIEYCTDNAAMIANYANYMFLDNQFSSYDIIPEPRLKF